MILGTNWNELDGLFGLSVGSNLRFGAINPSPRDPSTCFCITIQSPKKNVTKAGCGLFHPGFPCSPSPHPYPISLMGFIHNLHRQLACRSHDQRGGRARKMGLCRSHTPARRLCQDVDDGRQQIRQGLAASSGIFGKFWMPKKPHL